MATSMNPQPCSPSSGDPEHLPEGPLRASRSRAGSFMRLSVALRHLVFAAITNMNTMMLFLMLMLNTGPPLVDAAVCMPRLGLIFRNLT